ncbi:hypothetical protein AB0F72_28720 [Actinoplanes sp. NPDC023936]|uniref:hypothetical protein n=1 Tax=Actinoplanes sp. NPDC023936 TaxID=3154910 RepID=UPI0033F2C58C
MRKRLVIAAVVAGFTVAGCGTGEPEMSRPPLVYDESVTDYKLINDVMQIDFNRRNGKPEEYALVPGTRPPSLLRMTPGGSRGEDGSFVMTYQFGEQWHHALVELSPRATDTCESVKADGIGLCVRDGVVPSGSGKQPHVAVYFTGNVTTEPRAGDPETDKAIDFWSTAEMVTFNEATWVTDLLVRGKAAAEQ